MAVELDDGEIGVTYVLRKEIGHACYHHTEKLFTLV